MKRLPLLLLLVPLRAFALAGEPDDLSVANAAKGAWYTVYTNDAVSGTYRAAVSLRAEGRRCASIFLPSALQFIPFPG